MPLLKNKDKLDSVLRGKLYSLEFDDNKIGSLFDKLASTDLIYVVDDLLFGVALRINFKESMHKRVTIRYSRHTGSKTEYQKTIDAFKKNSFTPFHSHRRRKKRVQKTSTKTHIPT